MSESQDGVGQIKRLGALIKSEPRGLPTIYLASTEKAEERPLPKVYLCEHESHGIKGRLKWMASTCLAGTVGLCLIGVAVYGSMNMEDGSGMMSSIKRAGLAALRPMRSATLADDDQSPTALKADRIETTSAGFANRQVIHETVVQHQGAREFITIKPYVRLVVGLSTEPPADTDKIPPFNPFQLYSDDTPIGGGDSADSKERYSSDIADLPLDALESDGIELGREDVLRLIAEAEQNYAFSKKPFAMSGDVEDGGQPKLQNVAYRPDSVGPTASLPHNLTVINKTVDQPDNEPAMLPGSEVKAIEVKSGDSMLSLIQNAGASSSQARAIVDAMKPVFSPEKLQPGQELRFTMVPTPSDTGDMEPVRVSLFDDDKHLATVARSMDGDYLASDEYVDTAAIEKMKQEKELEKQDEDGRATLYTAFYDAARKQHLSESAILKLLRVHSYDVDFKQKTRSGDTFEAFFDVPEDAADDETSGELLYTSMTVNNVTRTFYRFRTPDGVVDYYDPSGNSAKKFLMRNPVRGGRYSSGFGYRRHPLLGGTRMHTGVDWAAPRGTGIVAAGDGTVESVGRNGAYGNYVRIRHSNGFATAYGHMSKFADGLHTGVHVKQGQVIGYVGSTGRSTGPHCHFEVLVNNKFVNPMTIQVPRGLQLQDRELAEFENERARIDHLMQLDPVTTRVADVNDVSP
ncbi:peptidoglycan DD-metalloendopeptidase family protein [Methyloligella sp. 2.7D]|uniref:M23 family metallopeptidase n=1 Tax=unclassified Methyloligella TaxID=2625955 RepID=UPI00157E2295|nr:M23 family metallopeptidase [Methyloligella sp. GL2]QKP76607.1 peptidoglycan DD-metalloendopeptidase family protein [Methyloligella sp. GL2]